ncbi:MAG TPA: response regulator [Cyclobacteriaceae bacterium]|nr:response regulator [Cyclobacteriaceae bacterium]
MRSNKTIQILLADDDAVDRELFSEALKSTQVKFRLDEVSGGEEVFAHLNSVAQKPDLIILDLNMPVKDGRETLRELKANKNFKCIPVVILSTSNSHFDVRHSYDSGASLFLTKPHSFHDLVEMLNLLLNLSSKFVSFTD